MSKPWIHSLSSARKFGGKPEDYIEIHEFLDSTKAAIADNRHRCILHTSWAISNILPRIKFNNSIEGPNNTFPLIKNSDDRIISVRDIGEQHILEDFRMKYIPTPQDYIEYMDMAQWMNNGMAGSPSSAQKIQPKEIEVSLHE